jgi:hypothetical protein
LFKRILFLFIFLLACSAQAGSEIIYPESVGTLDEWTNVGGADKIASLTDADDASYINSSNGSTNDTQEVNVSDLTVAEGADVIDSVRVFWRTSENGIVAAMEGRASIMIGSDVLNGTTRSFSGTGIIVEYTESFTSPPGSRGTWDIVEVDSLVTRLAVTTASAGDHVRVYKMYIEVFFTSASRQVWYMSDVDPAGCALGEIALRQMYFSPDVLDTFKFAIPANSTDSSVAFIIDPVSGTEWTTAGFSVRFKVIGYANTPQFQVKVHRANESCVSQEATAAFPSAGNLTVDSTGNYRVEVGSYNWATATLGDFVVVEFLFDNASGQPVDSLYIETSDTTSAVYSEMWYAPSGQGSGSFFPVYDGSGCRPDFFVVANNAESSTTSGTFVRVDATIAGTNFDVGEPYLVVYDASIGASNNATVGEMQVNFGSTEIAQAGYEASTVGTASFGLPRSGQGGGFSGFYLITGTGAAADSLWFAQRRESGTGTVYNGGRLLAAMGFGDLVENSDYWISQQNSSAAEVTTTTTLDTLLEATFNLSGESATKDYILLMSCEVWNGTNASHDTKVYGTVDDVMIKDSVRFEYEDAADRHSWSAVEKINLTAASHTLRILYGATGGGTSTRSARRGRIILVDTAAYDQVQFVGNDIYDTVTVEYTTWQDWVPSTGSSFADVAYTPNQEEAVLILANNWMTVGENTNELTGFLRLQVDSAGSTRNFSDVSTYSPRSVDVGVDTTFRRGMITATAGYVGSAAITWTLQASADTLMVPDSMKVKMKLTDGIAWGQTLVDCPAGGTTPKRRRKELMGFREEDLRPKDIANVLGLPCDCPNDSLIVRK